jgi:hypothetical protein
MKKVLSILALSGVVFAVTDGGAANSVQKTADNCVNAHAILMASSSGNHGTYWEAIQGVIASRRGSWTVVSDYEPGVAQKISFRQYDTKFTTGGTAYVAHCGEGATCNLLAEAVLKRYPESGSPSVWCGEVPHILDNPQSASVQ